MVPKVSVIICTYNPTLIIFKRVLKALIAQTLPSSTWELLVIDNNSSKSVKQNFDFSILTNAKIIEESKPGLSHARICGVNNAESELIVFVDDDNILDKHYLERALGHATKYPKIGCFGGRSIPEFEINPTDWFLKSEINLGCQNLGSQNFISNYQSTQFNIKVYPTYAPIGTGMVITKKAFLTYYYEAQHSTARLALGRKGKSLTSGEDNDIVLTIIKNGFEIGYFPDLLVTHAIPSTRLHLGYLKKMAFESNRSWVKVLHIHQINPWRPISKTGLVLRLIKNYILCKPWLNKLNNLKWQSIYGKLTGLSEL